MASTDDPVISRIWEGKRIAQYDPTGGTERVISIKTWLDIQH